MAITTGMLTGAKEIALSDGSVTLVDASDFDYLSQWKWKNRAGRAVRTKHLATVGDWREGKRKDTTVHMHREVVSCPEDKFVDHINGDPLDNRRSNLRVCTHAQNTYNRVNIRNKNGIKGVWVSTPGKSWYACIRFMGKSYRLGTYDSIEKAAKRYDEIARHLFGEFASLNYKENI